MIQVAMATGLSPEHKTLSDTPADVLLAHYGSTPPTAPRDGQLSPPRGGRGFGPTGSELATSWAAIPTHINGGSPDPVEDTTAGYPTAAEILDLLHTKVAILSGGRDKQGRSIITFPAQTRSFDYSRDCIRRVVQYLACIPTEDVREYGFSVVVDGRSSNWQNIKLILRTLQEGLPGQITVVFTIQPGQFWQKQQSSRGHSKEKGKLEFSTEQLSSTDKLIRYVESSQLTSDLGGFLPYNHDLWIKLRLDLERFISSFNALMEHTAHVEQQLVADGDPSDVEVAQECLTRLMEMQEQLRKAPQNTIREGNDLLRALEQGREDAGTSGMTPDKINAKSIIRKLLDKIGQRQMQLDDLWRERKATLEQSLQLRVFEKSLVKVRFWLKSRGEEQLSSRCDIGTNPEAVRGLLEQHDKFEAKAKHHRTALTQLRRMADRFSGEQMASADSLQRQVSKLTSRFSKFDNLVTERKVILESSLQLHVNVNKWRGLCKVTSELLQQEMAPTDPAHSPDESGDHMTQLWQVADSAISEASSLIERMKSTSSKLPSEGSKGAGPGYGPGVDHVSRLIEEIQNHRHRVGQLAEARRLQGEELRRLHSCEKDTSQVIQWLGDMLTQQLLPGHGDVGDSVPAVSRLIIGHSKFSDNAHKTFKYGLDLVTAAQRTRVSCRLDNQPSSALLSTLDAIWSKLSAAMDEVKGHLDTAKEFHGLTEESLSSYTEWRRPLHQLPKTPSLIQDRLTHMTHNHQQLLEQLASALRVGESLVSRMERPLTSNGDFPHPNEAVKSSLTFLRGRLGELCDASKDLETSLPQQVQLLNDFLLYCQFESGIEKVLLWLQEHGLKQMHTLSLIKEGQSSVREQMESLNKLQTQVKVHSVTVEQIHSEAGDVDDRIRGFKSDLVTKATTLKTVWDKFTARLEDRRAVISLAASFYGKVEETRAQYSLLETSAITNLPVEELAQSQEKLGKVFGKTISEGQQLLERFKQSPGDQGSVVQKLTALMEDLRVRKNGIDCLITERTRIKGHAPASVARSNGVVGGEIPLTRRVPSDGKVSKKYTHMYGELEEEAYKHIEELETKCDVFLSSHTHLRDTPDSAKVLSSEYDDFLLTLDPIESKLERVVQDLTSLCPKMPPLASSIQQLCASVRGRVEARRVGVEMRGRVLRMYNQFCELVKEVKSDLSVLDEFLSDPVDDSVSMETLQTYKKLMDGLSEKYTTTKSQGEQFLEVTSEMLTTRVGPRLEVGGACTSVAFDLGDLEGRYPDLLERWGVRERVLSQQMSWQSFKANYDEITTWLRESAGKFLETRVDVGMSLETAEDLLSELGEFEIRAKRIAEEVESLLVQSEALLSTGVRESSELGDLAWDLRCLHDDFRQQLDTRNASLKNAVSFFMTSDQVRTDMQSAVESCDSLLRQDLPTHLKITSVSTRLVNLQHEGRQLLEQLGISHTPDHAPKGRRRSRARRTESASASELAIKQMLATLQKDFNTYKKAVERRMISSSPQPPNLKQERGGEIVRRSPQSPNPKSVKGGEIVRQSPQPPNSKSAKGGEIVRRSPQPPNPKSVKGGEIVIQSPQPPKPKSAKGGEIVRSKSDLKAPPSSKYHNDNKNVTKNEKKSEQKTSEDDLLNVPVLRARANTGEAIKTKKRSSAVLQRIAALNQKSTKEDAVALKEFGTTFAPRPRANTADPTLSPSKPSLPRKAELPKQPDPPQPQVVLRGRSPTDVDSVPLRKKGGGVTRTERKDKINAIRKIFEASTESLNVEEKMTTTEDKGSTLVAPAVVKAVLKDHLPTKQRVVTITMEPMEKPATPPLVTIETDVTSPVRNNYLPDSTDLPVAPSRDAHTLPADYTSLHSRLVRATRSASPQATNQILATPLSKSGVTSNDSSPIRRASKRPPPLRVSGKVSSLRDMFDSQAKEKSPSPRLRTSSYSGKSPAGVERGHRGQRFSVGAFEPQAALLEVSSEFNSSVARQHSPDITPKEEQKPPERPRPPVGIPHPLEDEPDILEHKPLPQTIPFQSTAVVETTPPPRPPSPVVDIEDSTSSGSETSEFDFDISSDEIEDSLSEDEGVDGEELDSAPRLSKSVSTVLSELIQSERAYLPSVEVLATVYLPMFSLRHVPTFLQGRVDTVLPNLTHIHTFHREFSASLCRDGNTIEDVCQIFIQASDGFQCYVPFLIGTERGLEILSEYGGSFFEDKQRLLGNDGSILKHHYRLKERMIEYDHHLRDLLTAAQKEALYAVELAMEALKVVQKLLRSVDNTLILDSLRGFPHSLTLDHMIRRDVFQGYITNGKKKIREYHVILTPDHVIFTRPRGKGRKLYYEFTESLKVSEMHMLETYKSRDDTFALCEGNLSADNLRVLTPVFTPLLMKTIWIQEVRPLLQKNHSRRTIVSEEDTPLPYCFHGDNMPRPLDHVTQALDERIGTLKRGKSFLKRTRSLHRTKRKPPTGEGVVRTQSVRDVSHKREAFIDIQEMGVAKLSQHDDAVSRQSQISSSSGGGVAGVQLGSLSARGQFLPVQEDELYLVVEPHTSERDGFLSVERGQLVEVLDNSRRATWMVLTVARQHGELEMEGFLPSSCLRLATKDEIIVSMSAPFVPPPVSHDLSHDISHDVCEAGRGQEVNNSIEPTESLELERSLDHTPSQSTGQNISGSITIVPHNHGNQQGESPTSPKNADSAQSSPMVTKRSKPPILNLTIATPTLSDHATPTPSDRATPPYHDQGPHLSPMIEHRKLWDYRQGEDLTSSIRSLPSTFSPVTPKSNQRFLGYNPMHLPEVTLSYPELGPPAPPTDKRRKAREELSKLREATVQYRNDPTPGSVEEFDPVLVYVAIADFEAVEDSSISLTAGQCVEVLDSSRSDWWLVFSSESGREGWVPACYLGQFTLTDPSSPPPEPFEDENGELAALMGRSSEEVNRRELYTASFLEGEGPSNAQLQGMFSISHPYVAMTEICAQLPGQVSLVQDQSVTVVDSCRDDWWLVRTVGGERAVEGWAPRHQLKPDENIREDSVVEAGGSLATVTSAFEEEEELKPTLTTHPLNITTPPPQLTTPSPNLMSRRSLPIAHVGANIPNSAPLWVVLADYKATEGGMLSEGEGELLEVLDISRNEWCLVRPSTRPLEEGWVPMTYLKPHNSKGYANPSLLPPRFHQHSSSSDSDTPSEGLERSPVALSPEGVMVATSNEARTEAKERRRFVLSELANSERDYVEKLNYCLEHYSGVGVEGGAPSAVTMDTLFGNLADILTFHRDHFLPELQACEINPLKLGDLFVSCEQQLRMYVTYCRNKASSDSVYHDHAHYFEERRGQLRDRLKLPDYLILPVQRITKYTLLLHDFHKYSVRAALEGGGILSALEVSRGVSTLANNAIHLNMLNDRVSSTELGDLVMQDLFGSQEGHKQLYKERRIFLFERALIHTKRRRDNSDKESYVVKEQLMLRDISMTQDMDPGRLNIITYDMVTGTKFILRAPKTSIRDMWLARANELIRLAKQNNTGFMRGRSASEPGEHLSRTPTFMRRSVLSKRESTKRKSFISRPNSSSGRRSGSPEQQEPVDTEYVVMECIVMEGGDDVTLDPGDIVRLVSVESGGVLRVRTTEDPPSEGKILASYLRKKDSVKGLKMEAIPKFTMRPSDMDLLMGTTATISCAFNGYPIPSIIWRKDYELLSLEGERWKITSCSTSSVLEITRLDYEDEGAYSCYITNSQGSDSADMCLNIHGPPSQLQKPTASKITSSSVKLKWVAPDNDGKALIHSYQVEMLQEGFEEWQPIIQQPRVYFMVKNLLPNTSYHFRVTAINDYGASPPSEGTKVVMGVKGRWQSFRRGHVPAITINTSIDSTDGLFDELGLDDQSQQSRRGSISNVYDVMADELGRGQYGIVHRCVHKRNGTELAAKYVRLRSKRKGTIRKEVELLKKIKGKSPNLLEFCDAFEIGRNLVIVTEIVPDGELIERIIADNNLTEAVTVGYLGQLLSAVDTLHSLSIAHLDIRPENILLSGDTLKLIDFGSAKEMTSDLSPLYTSSVEFTAPEILNQELPTLSADMWSVGALAYVLLSGISPFFGENIQAIVERIKEARYSFYPSQFDQVSQEAKDFISALLQKTPEYRMTARKACDHPWIRTLRTLKDKDRSTSPWPMARLDVSGLKTFNARRKWVTMSVAIDDTIVFGPRSTICLSPAPPDFEEMAKNEAPPHLWDGPTKLQACVGSKVTISYSVAGNPEPTVIWDHEDVEVKSSRHHSLTTRGGVTLVTLTGVRREDEGVWSCTALNGSGSIAQECHLTVLDLPGPPLDVNAVLLGANSAMVSWLPPTDTGSCPITSYAIQRKHLQADNWEETTSVSDITAHVMENLVPGVSHVFRVAAANQVGVGGHSKVTGPVAVVSLQDSETDSNCDEVRLKMRSFELDYEKGQEIWRGTFASVLQCRERTTDRLYTAKHMPTITTEEKERALAEYDMHHSLSHPRVVAMEDAFLNDSHVTLVLEYVSGGSLDDLLSSQPVLTEQVASQYTRKIAEGLEYLHDDKIILVNLSPDNILLTSGHKDIKICDLGLSRFIESGNQLARLEGRVEFMSPEVVALQPLTTAADVWSLGTITYLMLTGMSPFLGTTPESTVSNIASCTLDTDSAPYSALLSEARDFVQYRALVRNPRRRPTAVQCQRHSWVQSHRQSSIDSSEDKPHPQGRRSSGLQDDRQTSKHSSLN